ncbi:MAG: hypothetical protein M3R64_03505 [Pseudomonadota bacterium]|nr:hypothetical protein [Pseudomonadota bacterium]
MVDYDRRMSRSRRHSPFVGNTTAPSDKPWKQQHARRVRRATHQALGQTLGQTGDGDAVSASRYAFGSAAWDGIKDGKQRVVDPASRWLRK